MPACAAEDDHVQPAGPAIRTLVDQFIRWNERHRSRSTARTYRSRLRRLVLRYGERTLCSLTRLEIDEHLHTAGEGLSADTRRLDVIALERLQSWAVEMNLLDEGARPVKHRLEKPAPGRRERIPTAYETRRLLAVASPEFRLIYQALRQCGARPNELCRATTDHYDRQAGLIVLAEHKTARKTGKPRKIVVGTRLAELIDESLRDRHSGHLFVNPSGDPWTVDNLSRTFRRLRARIGLPRELCLYLTRHEHGTRICQEKGIHAAARALGHANIQTTQRYVKDDDDDLRSTQDLFQG